MKLDDGRWPAELQKSVVLPQFLSHILPCSKGLHPTQLSTTTSTQHGHPFPPSPLPSRRDAFLPLQEKRRGLCKDSSKVWEETVMTPDMAGPRGLARWVERTHSPAAPQPGPAVGSSGGGRSQHRRQQHLFQCRQPRALHHQPPWAAAHLLPKARPGYF